MNGEETSGCSRRGIVALGRCSWRELIFALPKSPDSEERFGSGLMSNGHLCTTLEGGEEANDEHAVVVDDWM